MKSPLPKSEKANIFSSFDPIKTEVLTAVEFSKAACCDPGRMF